jgi:tRNA(Ile)-lysidine synthase
VLHHLSRHGGFTVHAAHLDHGLRGEQSAAEARAVAEIAAQWGIPCTIETAPAGSIDARKRGLQAGARSARYAFFSRVADAVGARWIATAHTADDQAETVVMRWVRGAGPTALAGIPALRGRVLRPLLAVTRPQVEAYLAEHGITPMRDPSNDDARFLRPRVRHDVMPALRALNPRAAETMARSAALLADDATWLDAESRAACERARVASGAEWIELDRVAVGALAMPIRRRVIRFAAEECCASVDRLSSERIDAAARGCERRTSGCLTLGDGLRVEFAPGRFRLMRVGERRPPPPVELGEEGEYRLSAWGLVVRVRHAEAFERREPFGRWEAIFDRDGLPGMLGLRSRRPGDYVCPEGMSGRKRVQDLLVDDKIPRWRRETVPVLTAGDDVVWVVGVRRDRRYRPKPGRSAIEVEVVNVGGPRAGWKGAGS